MSWTEHFSKIMPKPVLTELQRLTREMIWLSQALVQITAKMKGQETYYKLIRGMPFIPMACVTQCCLKQLRSSHSPYKHISLLLLLLNPSF